VSVLRRDDVGVNVDSRVGEEASERGELGVRLGFCKGFSDFRRRFHFEGTAAAILNG